MRYFTAAFFVLSFSAFVFSQEQAEVIVTSTYLRAEPAMKSEKIKTLQRGEKVVLENVKESDGWYFISTSDNAVKGWIRKDTIAITKKAEKVKTTPPPKILPKKPINKPVVIIEDTLAKKTSTKSADTIPPKTSTKIADLIPPEKPTTEDKPETISETISEKTSDPLLEKPATEVNSSTTSETTSDPFSEEPPPIIDREVIEIKTTEVSLQVRVVNAANRPVGNLTQDEFKVYEDGVLQPVTSLTTSEVPLINALVIDNSRSLRSQLSKVIEAGKIIIGTNQKKDESAIVRFVSSDKIEVVQDFTSGKNLLENALDNLFVEGGQTAIIDAIYQTAKKVNQYKISENKEDVKLRSLIIVSDGDDRGSKYNEQQLIELLRDSNVQIYVIGFINDLSSIPENNGISRQEKAKAFLTRLAEETGGKLFFPNSLEELPKIAADISGELRTQYLISYSPTNEDKNETFRKIKVEIANGPNQEKRFAVTRTGRNIQPK